MFGEYAVLAAFAFLAAVIGVRMILNRDPEPEPKVEVIDGPEAQVLLVPAGTVMHCSVCAIHFKEDDAIFFNDGANALFCAKCVKILPEEDQPELTGAEQLQTLH